jgi:hypothetical protein
MLLKVLHCTGWSPHHRQLSGPNVNSATVEKHYSKKAAELQPTPDAGSSCLVFKPPLKTPIYIILAAKASSSKP